ncbi:hypothetical protein RN001_011384 [Aquatica leii]|uniref:Uncharacterized protein n=1 Tax=Aquatica leii TaxID=1421715 RepID=A0AAN7SNQ2_9COLE|nr:hypothetical protein RN001_011384 [Aquatica leii]
MRLILLLIVSSSALYRNVIDEVNTIWGKIIAPYHDLCITETNANITNPNDSDGIGCYIKCLYDKLKYLDSNGEFNYKQMKATASYMNDEVIKLLSSVGQLVNMFPKCLVLITVLVSLGLSKKYSDSTIQAWTNLIEPYNNDCLLETNADQNDAAEMTNNGFLRKTEESACYLKCLYQKLEFLKDDGEIDVEAILTKAPYMNFEVSDKCKKKAASETDLCEKSYVLGNCILKEMQI